eukprot:5041767-Alexandrium_andersonii.AAC.1
MPEPMDGLGPQLGDAKVRVERRLPQGGRGVNRSALRGPGGQGGGKGRPRGPELAGRELGRPGN